jgi:hypothetical protein
MIQTARPIPEMKPKKYYLSLRHQYLPKRIKLVIVAESPPISGLYFYDANGRTSESLFAELMRQLRFCPPAKKDGLIEFKERGWVLVDATYRPVNGPISRADCNRIIEQDYELLRDDLKSLISDHSTPLVLIKKNVCRLLGPKLVDDGFTVLNRGRDVYFPSNGWQKKFREQFGRILEDVGL